MHRPADLRSLIKDHSSLGTLCVAEDQRFLQADSEDSDQTGQMPRLILVLAGRTGHFVGFVMLICASLAFQSTNHIPTLMHVRKY